MSEKLKPCPFCGGGNTEIVERPLSNQPRMDGKPSAIISVEVRHWCEPFKGLVANHLTFRGRDMEAAIEAWNRRHQEQKTSSEFERMMK